MRPYSEKSVYEVRYKFPSFAGGAACMAADSAGMWLAVGGCNGTRIWTLDRGIEMTVPLGSGSRGTTTALAWITRPDDPANYLVQGTEDGWLVVWFNSEETGGEFVEKFATLLQARIHGHEITSLFYDYATSHLVVAHRAEVIKLFFLDASMELSLIREESFRNHSPATICGLTRRAGEEFWSFGRDDGDIKILDYSLVQRQVQKVSNVIGSAAINSPQGVFCIDDPSQGICVYSLDSHELIRTLAIPATLWRPRKISFHQADGSAIVCGSDHGCVYVLDHTSGRTVDVLHIGNDWVQTVESTTVEGRAAVVTARSGEHIGHTDILVWVRQLDPPKYLTISRESMVKMGAALMLVLLALESLRGVSTYTLLAGLIARGGVGNS